MKKKVKPFVYSMREQIGYKHISHARKRSQREMVNKNIRMSESRPDKKFCERRW